MMNKNAALLIGLMSCLAAVASYAQTTNVVEKSSHAGKSSGGEFSKLGDPAPPITVKEWIKGTPVNIKAGTNIYVLVFCTLSRANEFAITNLSSLQKLYQNKGVVVVAISSEPVEPLKAFVQLKGGGN